jgi:hypothetical protein
MLRVRTMVAGAAAAAMATLALAAPSRADTVSGSCDAEMSTHLDGNAHFVVQGNGWRTWHTFAAKLRSGENRKSNNVNFYFYQDYATHWAHYSPDNVHTNVWYSTSANINMPPWSLQQARWEGIFDLNDIDDPNCSAYSPIIGG